MKHYVNRQVSSDIRATVLSVNNLVGRVIFAAVGPAVGWIADTRSMATAFLAAGSFYLVTGLVALAAASARGAVGRCVWTVWTEWTVYERDGRRDRTSRRNGRLSTRNVHAVHRVHTVHSVPRP
jgi:hypothetical protein